MATSQAPQIANSKGELPHEEKPKEQKEECTKRKLPHGVKAQPFKGKLAITGLLAMLLTQVSQF